MADKLKEHCETGVNVRQPDYDSKKKKQSESDKVVGKVKDQVHNTLSKNK